ncbi:ergosterol biosynthesis ERG4/ERG24 [Cokeromyces recurvatus]|uniref:ergosterol biosynthesis ERG4/ERG24 n=1 Tax=Cokeromyces recurvatus TaxID=90255 RepID=UPI00221E8360|nr:ergosterol biosynthesis ERG4/ERG24 [Cokeromyces recurvatus]KAI7905251.1 ergosterol biosynthesis ERG4/ERG24 [Cokeromyces recurvatus]
MAIQTRSASRNKTNNEEEQQQQQQNDGPPPNRAARRAAQKKEAKEAKEAKNAKTSKQSRINKRNPRPLTTTPNEIKPFTNPKTTHYEFGGVLGATGMILFLPVLVLTFAYGCDKTGYNPLQRLYHFVMQFDINRMIDNLKNWHYGSALFYLGIVLQLAAYSHALPGEVVEGVPLRDGRRLKYKINALSSLQSLLMIAIMALRGQGWFLFLWVKSHFADIALFSVVFSLLVSICVYISSFFGHKMLALGGNTGNPIYDFMIGRELNPRIGEFDIKFFTELRPGLILWLCLNICFAIYQWVELGRVTYSMILVNVFQAWYILDALINESSILTTMDITTDGFGFMLAFGNLCWVPMMYSLQARYLSDFPVDLSIPYLIFIIALQMTGYYIFRSANSQKDTFRKDPNHPKVAGLKYIETRAGSRLIISGWWGKARHINYLGDWLMSVAWCLPCGFNSIIPYFYCIYFAILLIHRERRDEDKCRKKYGEDWDRYCSIVKYRIIPGIY